MALGVVLALLPVSVGDVRCGTAISGTGEGLTEAHFADVQADFADALGGGRGDGGTDYATRCEDRVTTQRLVAFPVAAAGIIALVFLGLTSPYLREFTERPERSDR